MTRRPTYPDNLPDISSAKLPVRYEAAKKSLQACVDIDECQSWAKKAEALASYAKQSDDESLFKMCVRIKGRAIRRCGELLRAMTPEREGKRGEVSTQGGTNYRKDVAKQAGLSKKQKDTALRVANVPDEEFEAMVECETPASVQELAEMGTKKKSKLFDFEKYGIDHEDFKQATKMFGSIRLLQRDCVGVFSMQAAIRGVFPLERAGYRRSVEAVEQWLGAVHTLIKKEWHDE